DDVVAAPRVPVDAVGQRARVAALLAQRPGEHHSLARDLVGAVQHPQRSGHPGGGSPGLISRRATPRASPQASFAFGRLVNFTRWLRHSSQSEAYAVWNRRGAWSSACLRPASSAGSSPSNSLRAFPSSPTRWASGPTSAGSPRCSARVTALAFAARDVCAL